MNNKDKNIETPEVINESEVSAEAIEIKQKPESPFAETELEEELEEREDVETYILKKPITFDGKKIDKLVFDFDSLKARDLMNAERQAKLRLGKKRDLHMVKELDNRYTSCVAAKAAGVKVELLFELGAKDFTGIDLITRNFLLDGDSSDEEEI